MGLIIFLRKRAQINWFRDIVIGSINSGAGNRVILCSGFFQEVEGKYQASMERNFAGAGVNITAKYTSNLKWHAKIFILKNNTNPILGIIGSSNITRPAFSDELTSFS